MWLVVKYAVVCSTLRLLLQLWAVYGQYISPAMALSAAIALHMLLFTLSSYILDVPAKLSGVDHLMFLKHDRHVTYAENGSLIQSFVLMGSQ